MHGDVVFGDQLVGADTLSQIPDTNDTGAISTDEFALVGMDDHVVHWGFVGVVALQTAGARVPHFDCAILGTGDHPLSLAMKRDTRDVIRVAIEGHDRIGIGRLDVIQFDIVVSSGGQEPLVWRDAETVHL